MKTLIKVALIALLWITVINSGTLGGIDTELRLRMAHAWWTGGQEVAPNYQPKERGDLKAGIIGVGGKRYIGYDVGQSLLMLPADWLGTKLNKFFPELESKHYLRPWLVNFLTFLPLNVAAVVCCFWLLRLFDFNERIAGLTSIAWLLGTTVLHYAQVPQQNNQVLLFVTIGYAAALACVKFGRPWFAALSGLGLGAALLIRMSSVIHILTVLFFLVGCIVYQSRNKLKVLQFVGFWIVGFVPLALLGRVFDYLRYGSFWTTGQTLSVRQLTTDPMWAGLPELPGNHPFTNPPSVGIFGVLVSAAKSIFIYDPLLLPCLGLGIVLCQRLSPYLQWYLISGIFNLGLQIVLTSRLDFWHGDWAWGARYHVTSVHLLLIPLVALFLKHLLFTRGVTVWLMRGILVVAIMVQIASVTMPFHLEIVQANVRQVNSLQQFRLGQRVTNIVCLIDASFSEECISRWRLDKRILLEDYNQIYFLPFIFSHETTDNPELAKLSRILFVVWGLVLTLALATTIRFCFAK